MSHLDQLKLGLIMVSKIKVIPTLKGNIVLSKSLDFSIEKDFCNKILKKAILK